MKRWNWISSISLISSNTSSFCFFFLFFSSFLLLILVFIELLKFKFSLCDILNFWSLSNILSIIFKISFEFISSSLFSIFKLFEKNIIDLSYLLFKFSKFPTLDKHIFSPNLSFISLKIFWQEINLVILLPFKWTCSPRIKVLTLFKSYNNLTLSLNWESIIIGNIPSSSLSSSSSPSFELSFSFSNKLSDSSSLSLFFFKRTSFPYINLPNISLEFLSKSLTDDSSSCSDFTLCFLAFFKINPKAINLFISIPW